MIKEFNNDHLLLFGSEQNKKHLDQKYFSSSLSVWHWKRCGLDFSHLSRTISCKTVTWTSVVVSPDSCHFRKGHGNWTRELALCIGILITPKKQVVSIFKLTFIQNNRFSSSNSSLTECFLFLKKKSPEKRQIWDLHWNLYRPNKPRYANGIDYCPSQGKILGNKEFVKVQTPFFPKAIALIFLCKDSIDSFSNAEDLLTIRCQVFIIVWESW